VVSGIENLGVLRCRCPERGGVRKLFAGTGFSDPQIDEVPFTLDFSGVDDYWEFLTGAAGAIAVVIGRIDEDERRRVRGQFADQVAPFVRGGGIELPAASLVASAS
jgi:hypothetical protein